MKIHLYSDRGIEPTCLRTTYKELKAFGSVTQWKCGDPLDGDVFVVPGGLIKLMNPQIANDAPRIIDFVEGGGRYVGFCGGGYLGCARAEFDIGYPFEWVGPLHLGLFEGCAQGSVAHPGEFGIGTRKGSCTLDIHTKDGSLAVYHWGGCRFIDGECDVIARYDDKTPAIIKTSCGKGAAILTGIHIELPGPSLNKTDPYLSPLIPTLLEHEEARQALLGELFS